MIGPPFAEVVGDPIAHSLSPFIHRFWLDRLGLAGDYRPVRVASGELADYLARRRADPDWRGCNLTMPLKEHALAWIDEPDPTVSAIAAVNGIYPENDRLRGFNSDMGGIRACLGQTRSGRVVLVGTGGAARAALVHLREIEAGKVLLVSRRPQVAVELLERFELPGRALSFAQVSEIEGVALLINATPLGMTGFPPMPKALLRLVDRMESHSMLFEMVYDPRETTLLARARARGLRTVDGLAMLIEQARLSFRHFFGEAPDAAWDPDLRRRLAS